MKRVLYALAGICFLIACGGNTPPTADDTDGQVATKVSIFSSKENQKEWVLRADSVNFENMQNAELKNPQLVLKQNGQDSALVSGKRGTFNYEKQLVSIEGDALLEAITQQVRITSSEFYYALDSDKIWSDTRTVITRGTAKSIAKNGIETDSKLTKIVLKKHTTRLPDTVGELQRKSL